MSRSFWLERRTILALALSILALAEIIDLTIVSVALTDIMGSIGANINEISLTFTSYIVAAAIFIPLTGFVTNKFGVKRVVLVSAVLFGGSSILCGLSTNLTEMVFFRLLQGIGGAFLPSMAQAYIINNFKNNDRTKMMTVYSLCIVLGPIIGPIMGGVITEYADWRWVFYVNVPICLIGFFIVYFMMKESKTTEVKADYISFFFMVIGVGCLEYFLDEGNQKNWFESAELIVILTLAIIFIGFFIWRGILGKSVVNLQVFKYKNFVLSCFAVWAFMLVIVGTFAFFPNLLQQGYGYPVDMAGYITAPRGIASFLAAPLVMKISKKFDPRKIMFFGILVFACSTYMLTQFSVQHNTLFIILTCILQGLGMMAFFINIMLVMYHNLPHEYNSDASGVFNFFRNIGNSIGTAIASTILSRQQQVSWHDLVSNISPYSVGYKQWLSSGNGNYGQALMMIQKQSFFIANIDVFQYSLLGLILIVWIPFVLDKPDKVDEIILE
ncbi:MAG: MDR family MFS transporter [Neisseriaceae bacterium]|jgi:DHA2 family multidrug resistance protein